MTCATVTSQSELDAALADAAVTCVHIESEAGVWLCLSSSGSATVRAFDSATVRASGSATVRASGSATVEAFGSATVRAFDSATVEAFGSATVEAFGSATVRAFGSATVRAYGSATVEASDSATVRASGSTGVHAYGRSSTTATSHVAVHLHSARATIAGGVLIDLTTLDLHDPATWCDHHGVDIVEDGRAVLYKALGDDLTTGGEYGHVFTWTVGADLVCPDWRDDHDCGGGLHLSPRPAQASTYRVNPTRWMRCTVPLAELRPIDGSKAKARLVYVQAEVDEWARPVGGQA